MEYSVLWAKAQIIPDLPPPSFGNQDTYTHFLFKSPPTQPFLVFTMVKVSNEIIKQIAVVILAQK